MDEMKKDLRFYELKKASEHITPKSPNEYVPLPLQEDKENDVQPNGSVTLDEGPNHPIAWQQTSSDSRHHFAIGGKSLTYAPQNHDESMFSSIVEDHLI